jgi:hypothetical protein
MNKAVLIGLGILLLLDGLIVAYFAGRALITNVTITNMSSPIYGYLIVAAIAIAFLVAGGLLVYFGANKS